MICSTHLNEYKSMTKPIELLLLKTKTESQMPPKSTYAKFYQIQNLHRIYWKNWIQISAEMGCLKWIDQKMYCSSTITRINFKLMLVSIKYILGC